MPDRCQAHNQTPSDDTSMFCYGELFTCSRCGMEVCAGYGGCDDLCDRCFAGGIAKGVLNNIAELDPMKEGVELSAADTHALVNESLGNIVDTRTLLT